MASNLCTLCRFGDRWARGSLVVWVKGRPFELIMSLIMCSARPKFQMLVGYSCDAKYFLVDTLICDGFGVANHLKS